MSKFPFLRFWCRCRIKTHPITFSLGPWTRIDQLYSNVCVQHFFGPSCASVCKTWWRKKEFYVGKIRFWRRNGLLCRYWRRNFIVWLYCNFQRNDWYLHRPPSLFACYTKLKVTCAAQMFFNSLIMVAKALFKMADCLMLESCVFFIVCVWNDMRGYVHVLLGKCAFSSSTP